MNPYKILDITEDANDETILQAYLKKTNECSPEQDPYYFEQIRSAFESIKDEKSRLNFDLFINEGPDKAEVIQALFESVKPKFTRPTKAILQQLLLDSLKSKRA